MPIFNVTGWGLIALNVFGILASHLILAKWSVMLPASRFERARWWNKTYTWEDHGKLYERIFFIKKWKRYLPDGAKLFKEGFAKKNLQDTSVEYYDRFIIETRRAEFSHWIQMLPAAIFYLFNPLWASLVITVYFILINLFPIVAQRYVRPKLIKLKQRALKKQGTSN